MPGGFLLCDGSAVGRVLFADLFAIISTTFGVGDGSTTFNVPDCRQRFPLGKAAAGTGATLGEKGGNIDHTHAVNVAAFNSGGNSTRVAITAAGAAFAAADGHVHNVDPPNTTSSTANPAYIALNFIIRT